MSIVQKLTEGIVNRDLSKEGAALISKWENTGLLEGLGDDDCLRNGMARLLENQAKELLRESSSMASGDVEGFAAVAFPLVRRVFGSLIANDLVSVQPMSLPSGLIFFLDFTGGTPVGDGFSPVPPGLSSLASSSLYGGGVLVLADHRWVLSYGEIIPKRVRMPLTTVTRLRRFVRSLRTSRMRFWYWWCNLALLPSGTAGTATARRQSNLDFTL